MSTLSVFASFTFEAAHFLPKVPEGHKCGRMHGHNWTVEVHVADEPDERGWIVDFYIPQLTRVVVRETPSFGAIYESTMRIAPCTVKAAIRLIKSWHRHLPDVQGGLFAAMVVDDNGVTRGVAVAGNPSRAWQGTGRIVVSRVATDGHENACSALYGSMCRAAKALGYKEVWTYTLPGEPGTSLRAAGFEDKGITKGGEWNRPSRSRKRAVRDDPKRRWMRRLAS